METNKYHRIGFIIPILILVTINSLLFLAGLVFIMYFAKELAEHSFLFMIIGLSIGFFQILTIILSIIGITKIKSQKSITQQYVIFEGRKTLYYNAIFAGFLIYPIFIAKWTYASSGYSKADFEELVREYVVSNFFNIVDDEELFGDFSKTEKVDKYKILFDSKVLTSARDILLVKFISTIDDKGPFYDKVFIKHEKEIKKHYLA